MCGPCKSREVVVGTVRWVKWKLLLTLVVHEDLSSCNVVLHKEDPRVAAVEFRCALRTQGHFAMHFAMRKGVACFETSPRLTS